MEKSGECQKRRHRQVDRAPPFDRRSARAVHQPARSDRGDRHAAEDNHVVHALDAAAFFGRMCTCQHGCCADEAEVPPNTQKDERGKKVFKVRASQSDCARTGKDGKPEDRTVLDEVPG